MGYALPEIRITKLEARSRHTSSCMKANHYKLANPWRICFTMQLGYDLPEIRITKLEVRSSVVVN